MTGTLTDEKVLSIVDEMVGILRQPDPDPLLWHILDGLALTTHDVAQIIGAVAIAAGNMSLQAAGVDASAERVRLMYQVPSDDVPDWEKAAGALLTEAANFMLATGDEAEAHADALANRAAAIATHGTEFALRTLGAQLAAIRSLLMGDTWGVIRR
jgi:hypothetical protein